MFLVGTGTLVGKTSDSTLLYGLSVVFVLIAGILSVGHISGAAFNPAVAFGVSMWDVFNGEGFEDCWIYMIAPVVGGLLGGVAGFWIGAELEARKNEQEFGIQSSPDIKFL